MDLNENYTCNISSNIKSNYFTSEEFNASYKGRSSEEKFSLLHLNCRSLVSNYDEVCNLINSVNCKFDVIALSETWFHENTCLDIYNIDGYKMYTCNRRNKKGGGVLLYVSQLYSCNIIKDLSFNIDDCLEVITVELQIGKNKKVSIGCLYRAPNTNVETFNLNFCNYINKLKIEHHTETDNFVNNIFSFGLYPVINKPSRITSHSATLIDNIYTNDINGIISSGLIINDASDHLPIFCLTKLNPLHNGKGKANIRKPLINANTIKALNDKLKNSQWYENVINNDDINCAFNNFINIFTDAFDTCCPIKSHSFERLKTASKPWLNKSLINACKKKNNLYKNYLRNRSQAALQRYKTYKNKLTGILRTAEKLYYLQKLSCCKGDVKSTWKILNSFINKEQKHQPVVSKFLNNDGNFIDKDKI